MGEGLTSPAVTTLGNGGQPAFTRAEAIYAEQVNQLYRLSRSTYIPSLLAGCVVVAALWDIVSGLGLTLWALWLATVMGSRYALYRSYLRRQPGASDAR